MKNKKNPTKQTSDDKKFVIDAVQEKILKSNNARTLPDDLRPFRDIVTSAVYAEAIEVGGETPRNALRLAEAIADRLRCPDNMGARPDAGFYDLRTEQDYNYPRGENKARMRANGVPVRRLPGDVDLIVVHQTAIEFGVSNRAIAKSGGDVELARARRALDVACHVMAFRNGYFVAAHDLDVYVNHAGRFNDHSLGLEIEGRYPGLLDDPDTLPREDLITTWGGEPSELTDETVEASIDALAWMVETGRSQGMPLRRIASHRQSSDSRRSDPGQEIWQRIVLPVAEQLDLEVFGGSPWNTGRPLPLAWDETHGNGRY